MFEFDDPSMPKDVEEAPAKQPKIAKNGNGAVSDSEKKKQARRYIQAVEPAIEGQHGDDATYRVACLLVNDFDLPDADALELLGEFNERCKPNWDHRELEEKLSNARKYHDSGKYTKGEKVRSDSSSNGKNGRAESRTESRNEPINDSGKENSDEDTFPPFIDWAPTYLAVEDPPVEWIIPELMPRRVLKCWHGEPRTMKSLAALEEAIAAATGTPAFGLARFQPSHKFRVLYCSQEDGNSIVRPRAKKILQARGITEWPETLAFAVHKGISFDDPRWQEHLLNELTRNEIELVVFDPARYFTVHADQGPADVMTVTKYLRRIVEANIAVHVPHHDVKPPANGADNRRKSHRASGGGWFSSSEVLATFEKVSENQALVTPEDYKIAANPQPFTFRFIEDENGIRLIGENSTAAEAATLAIDEKVMEYLAGHCGASGRAITQGIRKSHESVTDSLERLFRLNRVDCTDLGRGKGKRWMLR